MFGDGRSVSFLSVLELMGSILALFLRLKVLRFGLSALTPMIISSSFFIFSSSLATLSLTSLPGLFVSGVGAPVSGVGDVGDVSGVGGVCGLGDVPGSGVSSSVCAPVSGVDASVSFTSVSGVGASVSGAGGAGGAGVSGSVCVGISGSGVSGVDASVSGVSALRSSLSLLLLSPCSCVSCSNCK